MMGKKMKLSSIFKQKEVAKQPWQWPSCNHPKTLSFRSCEDMFKTMNLVFLEQSDEAETPESWFTNSSETTSCSTKCSNENEEESLDIVVRGARSERLFFEPGGATSSILEKKEKVGSFGLEASLVVSMESENPCVDFRKSMEEMVESHGSKDWEFLEELLSWYLKVNGKKNHGFVVTAFVDLLVDLAVAGFSESSSFSFSESGSYTSALSSFPSCDPPLLEVGDSSDIDGMKSLIISELPF